jgi:beta-N-acetylhexosaminidase
MQLELPLPMVCGQLIIGGFTGTELPPSVAKSLKQGERGGVVLFKHNISGDLAELAALNGKIRDNSPADLPPLIGVDQEGGRVARLGAPVLKVPPMGALGKLQRMELVRRVARAQATELKVLGFTMNFAPVLDVNTCPDNPVIGDRSFGGDPHTVMRLGVAYIRGLQDGDLLACGKHFPGHGDTTKDSHKDLPVVPHNRQRLEQIELPPFRAAVGAGVAALMTAHVAYEGIDPGVPATMSRSICASLLRREMAFEGALLSDDLEMKAISDRYSIEDAACEAVWAGCDGILICFQEELQARAHQALVHRAEGDPRFRARCIEAAQRLLRIRRLVRPAPLGPDSIASIVGGETSRAIAKELAELGSVPS